MCPKWVCNRKKRFESGVFSATLFITTNGFFSLSPFDTVSLYDKSISQHNFWKVLCCGIVFCARFLSSSSFSRFGSASPYFPSDRCDWHSHSSLVFLIAEKMYLSASTVTLNHYLNHDNSNVAVHTVYVFDFRWKYFCFSLFISCSPLVVVPPFSTIRLHFFFLSPLRSFFHINDESNSVMYLYWTIRQMKNKNLSNYWIRNTQPPDMYPRK